MNPSTPGPCKPMALMSPLVDLDRARRRIAADRTQPDALDHHGAELVQVEELRIFDAVTERAGGDHHRVLQFQIADLNGQIFFGLLPSAFCLHFATSHSTWRESNTGPSVQVR